MDGNQPGQLIVPHDDTPESQTPPTNTPTTATLTPEQPTTVDPAMPVPDTISSNAMPAPSIPATEQAPRTESESGWQFRPEEDYSTNLTALSPGEELSWTASEFIAHEKAPSWYGLLALGTLAIIVITYFITGHDKITTGIIFIVSVIFGIFASRKPRVLQYAVSEVGLHIGEKTYGYEDFRSFSVAEEGAIVSIVFMPLKRFMPTLTIYLAPDIEEKVVDVLSERLPMEAHRQDAVDGFLKRIRF